jgi:hypothetical protein
MIKPIWMPRNANYNNAKVRAFPLFNMNVGKSASMNALIRSFSLALLCLCPLLVGCDQLGNRLGLEDPAKKTARLEAEGKAVGGACRQSGRAIEDCYAIYTWVPKEAIFAGWREMDEYMRENNLDTITPILPPPPPPEANTRKKKKKSAPPDGDEVEDEDNAAPAPNAIAPMTPPPLSIPTPPSPATRIVVIAPPPVDAPATTTSAAASPAPAVSVAPAPGSGSVPRPAMTSAPSR